MRPTDKNIVLITAGGTGQRFGADIPKQYLLLNGRPVISYVIDACRKSTLADAVLVAADPAYHDELRETYGVDVCPNGQVLNVTKRRAFDYIRANSSSVRPMLRAEVLDRFFTLLDEYDAIACARRITDSLGRYGQWVVDREEYYTLNPPEGFRFSLLDENFRADSEYTESIQQLPESSRVYLDFDVPYFDKITYPEDIKRLEAMMRL